MKFSILVPVYNVEKYLEQCVDSLLLQDYNGEYEIILVDDGSTDSSGSICDRYAKQNPSIVKVIHKKNEGVVSARKTGIDNATGEVCLFIDSDDFVETNLLSTVEGAFSKNSDADMIIYTFFYYADGKKIYRKNKLFDKEIVYENEEKLMLYSALLFTTNLSSLCTKAVKTEMFRRDATDYTLYYNKKMAEDWFQSINLITMAEKIVYINEPLYNYRTNLQSVSRSFSTADIDKKNILYVYDRLTELLPIWGMNDEETRKKLKARWLNETMYTFSKYMENAGSVKDIRTILNYNWSSMLPEGVENNPNEHENKSYRYLFEKLKSKKYVSIILFFIKKKAIRKIRDLKSKVLGK